jgi:hypothetical protein
MHAHTPARARALLRCCGRRAGRTQRTGGVPGVVITLASIRRHWEMPRLRRLARRLGIQMTVRSHARLLRQHGAQAAESRTCASPRHPCCLLWLHPGALRRIPKPSTGPWGGAWSSPQLRRYSAPSTSPHATRPRRRHGWRHGHGGRWQAARRSGASDLVDAQESVVQSRSGGLLLWCTNRMERRVRAPGDFLFGCWRLEPDFWRHGAEFPMAH